MNKICWFSEQSILTWRMPCPANPHLTRSVTPATRDRTHFDLNSVKMATLRRCNIPSVHYCTKMAILRGYNWIRSDLHVRFSHYGPRVCEGYNISRLLKHHGHRRVWMQYSYWHSKSCHYDRIAHTHRVLHFLNDWKQSNFFHGNERTRLITMLN